MTSKTALAIAAHPDDIEFKMAGTLLHLKARGWEIHCFNLATGHGGSTDTDGPTTAAIRREEAQEAARVLGAVWHPPIVDDLEIFYNETLLRQVAAVVREVRPGVVLTHPLQDYMEDHMITARLAVTAAFAHGIPNYRTDPPRAAFYEDVTVYHCMPHGGCDPLRRPAVPAAWVDTTSVHSRAREALAAHASQRKWLDESQGTSSYLDAMDEHAREMGIRSGRFEMAEGWWRHLHLGFSAEDIDPLAAELGEAYLLNETFEGQRAAGMNAVE
jgi:N-acetylglucosamine malate deacetylase 1